jgi:hypothetical protein
MMVTRAGIEPATTGLKGHSAERKHAESTSFCSAGGNAMLVDVGSRTIDVSRSLGTTLGTGSSAATAAAARLSLPSAREFAPVFAHVCRDCGGVTMGHIVGTAVRLTTEAVLAPMVAPG